MLFFQAIRRLLFVASASALALVAALGQGRFEADAATTDWAMYRHDGGRSGYNPSETAITTANAGLLKPRWVVKAPDTISSEAVLANGSLYWGSWDGYEHATNPSTGAQLWATYIGDETKTDCSPPHLGVASTANVASIKINGKTRSTVFVGGGNGSYYALDAGTGSILWSTNFGSPQQGYFMWSSPLLYNNSLYLGISSIGDCPLIPGKVVKVNASTGAVQATFNTVPAGCVGGGVWTSPTIDTATGLLYVTTGTTGSCSVAEPYSQAILALSSKTLTLAGAWAPPASESVPDGDFGASPTLFTATIGGAHRQLVGAANKNGIYYAFDRAGVSSGPVWRSALISTDPDTIASSAWDGSRLYVAGHHTVINGATCEASMRAVDPNSGAFVWEDCLSGGGADGSVTAVPGLVMTGIGSVLYVADAATGKVVFSYQDTSFHWFYSPPVVSGDTLYIGNSDGNLYAFSVNGI